MLPSSQLFWAKLDAETSTSHALLAHLIDVAEVSVALWVNVLPLTFRSRIARGLGLNEESTAKWVAFCIGAHDIGKASPAFQAKSEFHKNALKSAGFDFPPNPKPRPHGTVSTAVLRETLVQSGDWPPIGRDLASRLAVAVGGHHGVFPKTDDFLRMGRTDLGGKNWYAARLELLGELAHVIGLAGEPVPVLVDDSDHALFMLLAGLCSVADWLGSNQEYFPFVDNVDDTAEYAGKAREQAKNALDDLGWSGWNPNSGELSFQHLFGFPPRPLQSEAERYAGTIVGPGLVLVEAPMGEGKTEAALLLSDFWNRRLGQRGLYVALPTQATSNQMFGRVRDFLQMRYPSERVNLHLLHGHALLSEDFQKLRLSAIYDDGGYEGRVVAEGWFTPKKRGLLAPFGVGTIDQVLLAVLQTKHVFVRLFGLAHKTIILDEIHAYDVYMSTLLERLLAWLAALNCSVVLLSATLPKTKRAALLRAYAGSDIACPEVPYPRLLAVADGNAIARGFPAAREVQIQLHRLSETDLANQLLGALERGGCAAVICNTVGKAQSLYLALRDAFGSVAIEIELFHARFPFGRRDEIERRVLDRYGKTDNRPRASILVATQVIEQSLDLDFDVMVSEMAPIDLLLQRAGRLHRHADRVRPPNLTEPKLWLMEPTGQNDEGVPRFGGSEFVYDRLVLLRSFLALVGRAAISLPCDLEQLIEQVYGDAELPVPDSAWQQALELADKKLRDTQDRDQLTAKRMLIKPPDYSDNILEDFCRQLEEDSPDIHPTLQAMTRLSDPTVQLVCLHHQPSQTELSFSETKELLKQSVSLSHRGVVHHLLAAESPPAWKRNALLRNHRLAILQNGEARVANYCLRLDQELGIVITKEENLEP